ncbi:hypothetical protein [Mycobacterium sp. IDR2000157661]|uniref:hypothetical protein n=1 Tax=Mycobacterium sp. IDR2000157661 TaxID=2867005 RepID=UPI001EEC7132|nr:hypothetical protein [Mycobacterium sp. IDR2000157661]ULE34481.1 hypothetical protein K3G64_07620 [Mycobacterium sp. IDR2000157661]
MKVTAVSAIEDSRQPRTRGHATPYKLVVLAPDTTDAVAAAGGLIVDSTRAGWQVEIFLETGSAERALRILGVGSHTLPGTFDFGLHWPDAVVFAASTYDAHRGVRRFISDAARRHRANVACWGGACPSSPVSAAAVEHRLSSAAQAFKYYAMKALDVTAPASSVEAFHGAGVPPTVCL